MPLLRKNNQAQEREEDTGKMEKKEKERKGWSHGEVARDTENAK